MSTSAQGLCRGVSPSVKRIPPLQKRNSSHELTCNMYSVLQCRALHVKEVTCEPHSPKSLPIKPKKIDVTRTTPRERKTISVVIPSPTKLRKKLLSCQDLRKIPKFDTLSV